MVQLDYVRELLNKRFDYQLESRGKIILVELPEENFHVPVFTYLLEKLLKGNKILAVLSKFSSFFIGKEMTCDGTSKNNVMYLDCVSKRKGQSATGLNVNALNAKATIADIFGEILDAIDRTGNFAAIAFDDLEGIKNSAPTEDDFLRLFHLLLTKLRNKRVGGVILMLKSSFNYDDYMEIKQLVDDVIHVE